MNRKPWSVGCVGIVSCRLGKILVFSTTLACRCKYVDDSYIKIEFFALLDGKNKQSWGNCCDVIDIITRKNIHDIKFILVLELILYYIWIKVNEMKELVSYGICKSFWEICFY